MPTGVREAPSSRKYEREDASVTRRRKGSIARNTEPSYHLPCKSAAGFDPAVDSAPELAVSIPAPPPKKGGVPFSILYSLPLDGFTQKTVDGKSEVILGVAAVVLNHDGRVVDTRAERVTMTLDEDVAQLHPNVPLAFDQRLNLTKDDQYLYLAVCDVTSGRLGTLQIPLQVSKIAK